MYDINYFKRKFTEVPEEYLSMSTDSDPTDAWEWCNQEESDELYKIVRVYGILLAVNDGHAEYAHYGSTPKKRVLAFLDYVSATKSPYLMY